MSITSEEHCHRLAWMYLHEATINKLYKPSISIRHGYCEIEMKCDPSFFHAGKALHGSVYFKMLDDAAFFAANSMERSVFLLTTSFNIHFLRPVLYGELLARAEVRFYSKHTYIADARLINTKTNKEVALGTGTFAKSSILLNDDVGYRSDV